MKRPTPKRPARPAPVYQPKARPRQHGRRAERKLRQRLGGTGTTYSTSILSPHKTLLRDWFTAEVPLYEIQERLLKQCKCRAGLSTISRFRQRLQRQDLEEFVLDRIATGAAANERVTKALTENPAPQVAVLIGLLQNLIFTITTQRNSVLNTETIVTLFRPVMDYLKIEEKREDRAFEREKFAEAKRSKLEAGLDAIEHEIRGQPKAGELFSQLRGLLKPAQPKA